jgi:hypothetical protein
MSYDANYEQPTTPFTPFIQQENPNSSLVKGVSVSNQSPADDRFSVNSLISRPSTICAQKTHDQFMKNWYGIKSRNLQKKRRHRYVYGPPAQRSSPNDASSTTTLTPGILLGTDNN